MTKVNRERVIHEGTCYNFSLVLVQQKLLQQGCWTAEKAMELSARLSGDIQETVRAFFDRERKRIIESLKCEAVPHLPGMHSDRVNARSLTKTVKSRTKSNRSTKG